MSLAVFDFQEFPDDELPESRYATADELARQLQNLERDIRFCEAKMAAVLDQADRLGVYSIDGHRNIRGWAAANVWRADQRSRRGTRRAGQGGVVRGVPHRDTTLGAAQRHRRRPPRSRSRPCRRRVTTSSFDDTFHLAAQFGAIQGAAIAEILKRFENAEFAAEWDELKARFGDDAHTSMLERTNSQRRADALYAIFQAAASTPPDAQPPEPLVNIIIDQDTFEAHMAAAASGEPVVPREPSDTGGRCETDTGIVVDPAAAVAAALVGHIRRVVMNAAGVVIDLGRKQRVFTGGARTAVFVQDGHRCIWPGCGHHFRTEIDHSTDWQHLGVTAPGNGGPLCRRHNLFKNHGYHVIRDAHGHWHTHRPDGTEIHPI